MAGFGRIVLAGALVAAGLGTVALRAQTALEDPKNAPKIFANTCSACHKSPQGLGKNGSASFLRQHYTTGPEMSAAMASYLASAGSGPAPRKNDKQDRHKEATKSGTKVSATHSTDDGRPTAREKQKASKSDAARSDAAKSDAAKSDAAKSDASKQAASRSSEPTPATPANAERAVQTVPTSSTTAALNTPAPTAPPAGTPPPVILDIPMPELPTGPPADLVQPPIFSSAPLP